MKTPQARGVDTRRLYCFENCSKQYSEFALKQRTLSFLRRLAAKVWEAHGRKGVKCPVVDFGPGTQHNGASVSYCDGYSRIQLGPKQHDVSVLLHELTHAMGYGNPHGVGFVRKYFDLLAEYGQCNRDALVFDATMFKLKT